MLKTTFVELLLYGALLLIRNGVSVYSNHLSYTCCFGGWYVLESRCVFLLNASATVYHLNACLSGS